MKKIIAILFISIYLLNLAGGAMLFEYWIDRHEKLQVENIDEGNYDASQLVEIKIPLRLHYYSSSLNYERYYGEVEVEGQYYNYVMRKVLNDTVYLLCLPDVSKTELEKAKTSARMAVADFGGNNDPFKGKSADGKKKISLNDYYAERFMNNVQVSAGETANPCVSLAAMLQAGITGEMEKPPDTGDVYSIQSSDALQLSPHAFKAMYSNDHHAKIKRMMV